MDGAADGGLTGVDRIGADDGTLSEQADSTSPAMVHATAGDLGHVKGSIATTPPGRATPWHNYARIRRWRILSS
ncbi:MAG: hypothetical protein IPO93_04880 [Actinobacteria bacterium]|nr:hypothetical protein [Actinomycetota bacterium]